MTSESPSPDAPDLVVVSDLHLGEGTCADLARYSPMEDFFFDEPFSRLLGYLRKKYQDAPSHIVLVLNGDVFDFLTVTKIPSDDECKQMGIELSPSEKRFGLNPTAVKSVYKLDQIVAGHPGFFTALAQFVAAGHRVEILRGNHDLELHFEVVQQRLCRHLEDQDGGPTSEQAASLVRFHQWYYFEADRVYIEHGNQYEASNSIRYPFRPILPERLQRRERDTTLDYPLGSLFVRYFYNSVHRLSPHTPKVISFEQYLEFLRRHNFLDLLRIAKGHYPFFARAIGWHAPRGSSRSNPEGDRIQAETFQTLDDTPLPGNVCRELNGLKIHPMSSSKAALVERMALPVLRRATWVGSVAFISFYLWLVLFNLIQATPWVAENVFGKAILLLVLTVCTMIGLFWVGHRLAQKMQWTTDETVEKCAERAEKIAELTGAKLVLMGHTHVVDIRPVRNGRAIYANSGTWTSVDNPWDRLHPDARRFTLLWVSGTTVRVRRWNDNACRIDPVPMFSLPDARDLPEWLTSATSIRRSTVTTRPV